MSRQIRNALLVAGILLIVLSTSACAAPRAFQTMTSGGEVGGMGGDDFAVEEMAPAEPMVDQDFAMDEGRANVAPGIATGDVLSEVGQQQIQRLIIRNGSITLSVDDTRDAKARIEQRVTEMAEAGAFVVSSSENGGTGDSPYINMTIRIPARSFDETMDFLENLATEGTSPTVSESAQDVTEEYVDVSARLESLEAARDRLLELMDQAETTEALLQAEQQLTQREVEIEALQGRLRFLEQSADLSRIDITLQPYILSQPINTRWRPLETVRESLDDLLDGLRSFADFLIRFVVVVLPFLLIFGAILYGIVRFVIGRIRVWRGRRVPRQQAQPMPEETKE